MKIWFDTEFYEDGRTIDLISIGMVREDGATYYAETYDALSVASRSDWLKANVFPHLAGPVRTRDEMRGEILEFAGTDPEFWAYYADYDWVLLCQLFGRMIDLPKDGRCSAGTFSSFASSAALPICRSKLSAEHNALADALWTREAWQFLNSTPAPDVAGGEPAAWLHPTAGWAHANYHHVRLHCFNDGPMPVPLYRAAATEADHG